MSENGEKQHKNIENTGFMITIKKKPGIEKILNNLITVFTRNSVDFEMLRLLELKEGDYEPLEKTTTISIPEVLYDKLDKLCKINNWDTDEKIIEILGESVFSAEISDENGFKQVYNF